MWALKYLYTSIWQHGHAYSLTGPPDARPNPQKRSRLSRLVFREHVLFLEACYIRKCMWIRCVDEWKVL